MNRKHWQVLAVVLALLALTAVLLTRVGSGQHLGKPGVKLVHEPTYMEGGKIVHDESVALPVAPGDFSSEPVDITPLEVSWLPKDTLFGKRRYFSKDGFWTTTSVVLMGTDRTSIHKPQYCLDGQGWHIDTTETISIPMSRPYPYELRATKLTASKQLAQGPARAVYVYWFVADNELTPFHGERMWWMARDLIRQGVLQRWAYVAYLTVCAPGQEELYLGRLKQAIAATVPDFQLPAGPRTAMGATAAAHPNTDFSGTP